MTIQIKNLRMQGITKRFPGVIANDNITIEVNSGEVLALLGENGAGKTTLMNILYGLYQPDEGDILINNEAVTIDSPQTAFESGIGMVHQHFMLVPTLTVTENIALGINFKSKFSMDLKTVVKKIEKLSNKHGLKVNPDAYIRQLSVGEQQRVELVKALFHGANLLVLDEPTAALTPQETDELISLLREMAAEGQAIIFISHKLNEVMAVSDRVEVLRNGKLVFSTKTEDTSSTELARKMAGREVIFPVREDKKSFGKTALEINDVWSFGDQESYALQGLSLKVKEGEILGIAGVSGNGQKELAEVISGLREVTRGQIVLKDHDITNYSPQEIINRGLGYIPEDRLHVGTIPSFSVRENLILKDYFCQPFARRTFLNNKNINTHCLASVEDYAIKTPDLETSTASLSGGNIQKLILAREIKRDPELLVAAYPTRGLDIGAAEYVHNRLLEAREEDMAVVIISEELDELLNLCDRIAVIYEGKILKVLPAEEANKSKLGLLMAGVAANLNHV